MTDLLPALRSLAAEQPLGSSAHATLEQAAEEIAHLRAQRDELQRCNTRVVLENRDLRAQLAGRPVVRVMRVGDPALPPPAYATEGAAGLDLRADLTLLRATPLPMGAAIRDDVLCLYPGTRLLIPCGFAFEIPAGWEGQVCGRSGWTGRGLYCALGRVDSDFRGGVGIHVENRAGAALEIRHADRIAQMVIAPAPQARIEEAAELSVTARNTAGFGSTGTR